MYRNSQPIFDVPEFPALRRVKPLPKRRRTSTDTNNDDSNSAPPPSSASIGTTRTIASTAVTATRTSATGSAAFPLALPNQDATVEELVAHADALSAHMALQSYYMPLLGGVKDLLGRAGGGDLDVGEEHRDGDYVDHLHQPGNTKKRKVPAHASGSPQRGRDPGSGAEEEERKDGDGVGGGGASQRREMADTKNGRASGGAAGAANSLKSLRRPKMSPATLAGLHHKEMLKNRKRQLAAVLGALSHGDTLALDQALSVTYAGTTGLSAGVGGLKPKVRLSRREGPRLARAMKSIPKSSPSPNAVSFPQCEFTFRCPSATSDRLIATKAEVAMLRSRFEAELTRQSEKAAKLAAANKLMASLPLTGSWSKRGDRAQQRARVTGAGGDQAPDSSDPSPSGAKPRGKKKKRSALANASNPHHLRNYVPSRLLNPGQQPNLAQSQNHVSPLPLRFLSAEIPPRRTKKKEQALSQLATTNPAEEWICMWCEYELFYGDESQYRRAVRSRKKILRRRRRARERAAAAASGSNVAKVGEQPHNTGPSEQDAIAFESHVAELSSIKQQLIQLTSDVRREAG